MWEIKVENIVVRVDVLTCKRKSGITWIILLIFKTKSVIILRNAGTDEIEGVLVGRFDRYSKRTSVGVVGREIGMEN